jgi:hypothetical protein
MPTALFTSSEEGRPFGEALARKSALACMPILLLTLCAMCEWVAHSSIGLFINPAVVD